MRTLVLVALLGALVVARPAAADKVERDGLTSPERGYGPGVDKMCCGYPLAEESGFALRFYWLTMQRYYLDEFDEVDIYNPRGFYLGSFPKRYVRNLRMEGSGWLADGRIFNYAGRCKYGTGICFEELNKDRYPFGRGAGKRALVPYKSVAVDPRLVPIGEPIYVTEFDGLMLPDGSRHDGCVRADDTGGGIKQKKMDFFVVSHANFRALLAALYGVTWITPHIEHPRCRYLHHTPSVPD